MRTSWTSRGCGEANGHDPNSDWPDSDRYWSAADALEELQSDYAQEQFANDLAALEVSDALVLVLPAGRSAHTELGWFIGRDKPTVVMLDDHEPELLHLAADEIVLDIIELERWAWRHAGRGAPPYG